MVEESRRGVDEPSQEVRGMWLVPFEDEHGVWPVRSHGQESESYSAILQETSPDEAVSSRELEVVEFVLGIILILLIAVGVVLWG